MSQSLYLDPIDAAEQPRENLIRYLLTAYPLRDPHLRYGFKQLLEAPGAIYQHPYLEGAQPYQSGTTLRELVEQKVLHPVVIRMFAPDRPLYQHQESAIKTAVEQQKNFVVATGTGSGKTECFLIPMMDYLLKHPAPGMQALILYPMNALVNDQVKRLRQLLCHQGDDQSLIRFGFYTSRTKKTQRDAYEDLKAELESSDRDDLLKLFTDEQRDSLDLSRPEYLIDEAVKQIMRVQAISREEIWQNPPQILVTNYSMLEHLLIRPKERSTIFSTAQDFKLLVVDEAHSYSGSTGTEVAMLIKRFKAAVGIESEGHMQGIATSATLGDRTSEKSVQQVKSFAQDLFSEPFEEVIWGDRIGITQRLGEADELPEGLEAEDVYEHFYDLTGLPSLEDTVDVWKERLGYLVSPRVLEDAAKQAEEATQQTENKVRRFLWFALKQHPTIQGLIKCLNQGPQPWDQLARSPQLWTIPHALDGSLSQQAGNKLQIALSNLVQLGTLARETDDTLPLLPVRLHLLFRSIEGLHACINPQCPEAEVDPSLSDRLPRYGKLYLNSKTECDCCASPVIELASCRKCGQSYGLTNLGDKGELQPLPRSLEALESKESIHVLTAGGLDSVTNDEGLDSALGDLEEDKTSEI